MYTHGMLQVYAASNTIIILGYLVLSILFAPVTDFQKKYTRWGAIVFFLTCGLHHFHNVEHAISDQAYRAVSIQTEHVLIDVAQAIAVWFFIVGMANETKFRRIPIIGTHDPESGS